MFFKLDLKATFKISFYLSADTYFNKTFPTKTMRHTGTRNPHYFRPTFKVSFRVSQPVPTEPPRASE